MGIKIGSVVVLAAVCIFGIFAAASCEKVPAGNVGIKVYLLGTSKGVDTEELGVGRYWIGINEELYLFPTFTQNYVWTADKAEGSENDESITFQTKEGLTVSGDIGISYRIDPTKVNTVFQKYRKGVGEITDIFLRNMVRDAFNLHSSKQNVEFVYGEGKSTLIDSVEVTVKNQVREIGIIIEKIYYIGGLRLPETVVNALDKKVEAKQRAEQRENELREAQAQAQKEIALAEGQARSLLVKAEAEAKAIRLKRMELNQLIVDYESVQRWNGSLPQVTGGSTPFVDLRK